MNWTETDILAKGRAVKERPILMSAPMVKAILDGRKTQTRCVVEPQTVVGGGTVYKGCLLFETDIEQIEADCRYGIAGEMLWVGEPFAHVGYGRDFGVEVQYLVDGPIPKGEERRKRARYIDPPDRDNKWRPHHWRSRPSIFMPRWASRITLEIIGVRVERLNDISEEDCIAEGCATTLREHDACCALKDQYRELWESINGPGSFVLNPWVWVLSFNRV